MYRSFNEHSWLHKPHVIFKDFFTSRNKEVALLTNDFPVASIPALIKRPKKTFSYLKIEKRQGKSGELSSIKIFLIKVHLLPIMWRKS